MPATLFPPEVEKAANCLSIPLSTFFDLEQTLDCGQVFRWGKQPGGCFWITAGKNTCEISQFQNSLYFYGVSLETFETFWKPYFDLDRDYEGICQILSQDPVLARAIAYAPGIRILRQDPWEALCSFIISQNNNIPRIKGILSRLCQGWGMPLGNGYYAFPGPETLAACTPESLGDLRAGFRARYLIDAAQKVASGIVDLQALYHLPLEEARTHLRRIVGVGPKVAECTLLYGCGRMECFPVDVWISRAMERLFPHGLPELAVPWAGIAQQYIFHYIRHEPQIGL